MKQKKKKKNHFFISNIFIFFSYQSIFITVLSQYQTKPLIQPTNLPLPRKTKYMAACFYVQCDKCVRVCMCHALILDLPKSLGKARVS